MSKITLVTILILFPLMYTTSQLLRNEKIASTWWSLTTLQVLNLLKETLETFTNETFIAICVKQQATNPDCKFRQCVPMTSKTLEN